MDRAQQLLKIAAGKVILENVKSEEDAAMAMKFSPEFALMAAASGFGPHEVAELAPIVSKMEEWVTESERFRRACEEELAATLRAPRAKWATCFTAKPNRHR